MSAPPNLDPAVATWIEAVTGSAVVEARPLLGGVSSEVRRCRVADGRTVVVRHITDRAWLEREPDIIAREAAALDLLATDPLVTPDHLASDPKRGLLAMTFVDGSVRVSVDDLRAGVETMAELAAAIASVPVPPGHGLPTWRTWARDPPRAPAWADGPLWAAAVERYAEGVVRLGETATSGLLHRDFHPLNLLWRRDGTVAVVDWVNACIGHPHAELGHCRWNLTVLDGVELADRFLDHYVAVTGAVRRYDHHWDLAAVLSFGDRPPQVSAWQALGRTDVTTEHVIAAAERFLASILG